MLKPTKFSVISALAVFVSASLFCAVAAVAQSDDDKTEKKPRRRSAKSLSKEDRSLIKVFEPIAISASDSTVRIQSGRRQVAVGTIVDESGLILTKASEVQSNLKCRLPNGEVKPAVVFGIDQENDLALLKIDAEGLAVAPLNPVTSEITRGSWLVSPTDYDGELTVGVVGVAERKIPHSRAFIGIQMENVDKNGGVRIVVVVPDSPAQKAKLLEGDVVVKIDDVVIENRQSLQKAIGTRSPGSDVKITIKREDKEVVVPLTLADATQTSSMNSRSRTQNQMGSSLSTRGNDFPSAFQHDTALNAKHCGGPVLNLDGQIVGINIARSGRVSSLAIPVDIVLDVIEKLKTGDYGPTKVYAERIERSEETLEDYGTKLASGKKSFLESEKDYERNSAKLEELERMKKEIARRIQDVYDERDELAKKKRVLKSKNRELEIMIRTLTRTLKAIKLGTRR